jgi:hypothetical protein
LGRVKLGSRLPITTLERSRRDLTERTTRIDLCALC